MDFKNFSTEDFVLNKQFREWVEKPDKDSNQYWHQFFKEHPQKIEAVKKAKDIVLKMNFRKYRLSSEEVDDLWNIIQDENKNRSYLQEPESIMPLHPLFLAEQQSKNNPETVVFWRKGFQRIAASLVGILMIAGLIWYFIPRNIEKIYTTEYGETLSIQLPDGSVATINANSTLKVPSDWAGDDARQVWLEGEAFFQVEKTSHDDNLMIAQMPYKFVVHSAGVAVEVVGTKFNVNSRHEKVQVVLERGKVKVRWRDQKLFMQPGDLVEVNREGEIISQKKVNPEVYSSWKEDKVLCDGTPISELIEVVEDRFGYEVIINDQDMKDIKVSGALPLDNIVVFNQVLSELINANVYLAKNKVFIVKQ